MAKLDWGENEGEMLHMVRATLQTHENMLFGSAEEQIDGVVPTVREHTLMIKFSKNLGFILNALILLMLGIMEYRSETRQPVIIYQPQAMQPQREHKSYSELPQVQAEQPPQDAGVPRRP